MPYMGERTKLVRKLDDESTLTVFPDPALQWYVRKSPDDALEKRPVGAFKSREAARDWADHTFPRSENASGGDHDWKPLD